MKLKVAIYHFRLLQEYISFRFKIYTSDIDAEKMYLQSMSARIKGEFKKKMYSFIRGKNPGLIPN